MEHACGCRGSLGAIHRRCLTRWLAESPSSQSLSGGGGAVCEICNQPFVSPDTGEPILPSPGRPRSPGYSGAQLSAFSGDSLSYVTVMSSASLAGFGAGVADYPWASIRAARESRRQRSMTAAAQHPPPFWARNPLLRGIYDRRSYLQCCLIVLLGLTIVCIAGALIYNWVQPGSSGVAVMVQEGDDVEVFCDGEPGSWMCVIEEGLLEPQCSANGQPENLDSIFNIFNETASSVDETQDSEAQPTYARDGFPCGRLRAGRLVNTYLPPCFFGRDSPCYVGLSAVDGKTGICTNGTCSFNEPMPWERSGAAVLTRGTCKRCSKRKKRFSIEDDDLASPPGDSPTGTP